MKYHVIRSSESRRDVVELTDYIAQGNSAVAIRFLDAVEQTFDFLLTNREVGQLCYFTHPEAVGLRVWPVEGFRNHLIFYRPTDDGVVVERVLHGARDIEGLFAEGD